MGVGHRETWKMAASLIETLRSVSSDDAVMSLSEDMGRFFSYTTDSSTVNLWPQIIVIGLLALAVIPLYELLTTGSYSTYPQSKNYYSEESQGYRAVDAKKHDRSHPGVHQQRSHGPQDEGDGGEGQRWNLLGQGDSQ